MHFHFEWFSVILRLNDHELLAFVYIHVECTLPRQSPIANRVLHKRQRKLIDVIDRHVMIFLMTYFRTTPIADVNFTSLVTSLITCHHCVSFTERTIFGCERKRGSWIHACNTTMQYAFVLHCCDVMALCTASQISNKTCDVPSIKSFL